MIHPLGAEALGIDFAVDYREIEPLGLRGIGTAEAWRESAILELPRTDDGFDRFDARIVVARPSRTNRNMPNLLGRDIFDNYAILYDRRRDRLELRP